jgi:hypothetical protein
LLHVVQNNQLYIFTHQHMLAALAYPTAPGKAKPSR